MAYRRKRFLRRAGSLLPQLTEAQAAQMSADLAAIAQRARQECAEVAQMLDPRQEPDALPRFWVGRRHYY